MPVEESFAAALIDGGVKHRILGVKLRPFSLWHLLILQVIDSPFVSKGEVDLQDLKRAVGVCGTHYRQSRIRKPFLPRWGAKHGPLTKLLPGVITDKNFEAEVHRFLSYVGDYLSKPEFSIIRETTKGSSARQGAPPPGVIVAAYDAAEGARCSVAQAWDMPIGEAYIAQAMAMRNRGANLDFLTPEEREHQAKLKATGFFDH